MILAIILIIIFFITAIAVWRLLFCHLFQIKSKLSFAIREKVWPDIHRTINTLTSLAAAAIVLTFSILKIFEAPSVLYKSYLIASLISFTFAILFGIGSMTLLYILRAQYMIVMRDFGRARKEKNSEVIDILEPSLDRAAKIERNFHILLYSQAVTFGSAIIFLVIFTIINL